MLTVAELMQWVPRDVAERIVKQAAERRAQDIAKYGLAYVEEQERIAAYIGRIAEEAQRKGVFDVFLELLKSKKTLDEISAIVTAMNAFMTTLN